MKKLFSLLIISLMALVACDGQASNVRTEMGQMAIYVNKLNTAQTPDEFHQAAQDLREVSLQAMNKKPSSIENDEDFNGYQQGMQQFIDALDNADKLAQEGDLAQAKAATNVLFQLKKTYHIKYK